MSIDLARRAKALRLCKENLGSDVRAEELEGLILALEEQGSYIEGLLKQEAVLNMSLHPQENVLPFQKSKKLSPLSQKLKIFDKRFAISSPCLIEGSTPFERKKLAFEIHSRSHKTLFMDLEKLNHFWDQSPLGLEDSTLFIPEVSFLNSFQQDTLLAALSAPESPLVICGTEDGFSALKIQQAFSQPLLHMISQAHFRLQRPLKEYLEMGFFKLFLESLS